LDIWGKLNVWADAHAKEKMTELLNPEHPLRYTTRIENETITIVWQHPRELTQTKFGSQLKTTLTNNVNPQDNFSYVIYIRIMFSTFSSFFVLFIWYGSDTQGPLKQ